MGIALFIKCQFKMNEMLSMLRNTVTIRPLNNSKIFPDINSTNDISIIHFLTHTSSSHIRVFTLI